MIAHIRAMLVGVQSLVVASVLLSSATAYAGDGNCVWNDLAPRTRQQALAAGLSGGPSALSAEISANEINHAEKLCGLTASNSDALRRAEAGYMLQVLAERWLTDRAQLSSQQLDRAWVGLDKKAKARFEQWAVALDHDPEAHDMVYRSFIAALGRPKSLPASAEPQLLTYVQGRALREVYERRF